MHFYQTIYAALGGGDSPPRETVLVCQSRAAGRRLLTAVAAHCGPLFGVRAETSYSLALDCCAGLLSAPEAPRLMNDDEAASALLSCVLASQEGMFTKDSAGSLPAARELSRTLTELETEQIGPLTGAGKQADLQKLREVYAAKKAAEKLWDRSDLLAHAAQEAQTQPDKRVVTLPAMRFTALETQLLRAVSGKREPERIPLPVPGDTPLPGADLSGLPTADPYAFRNARNTRLENCMGVQIEVEFVFRDILEKGYPLDRCAVVYSSGSYAPLLYESAAGFGVPVSMSSGVPIEQTRLSGALGLMSELNRRFFDAEMIRRLLTGYGCLSNARANCDAKTLRAAGVRSAGAGHLANILREYRVGWGGRDDPRQRYLDAVDFFRENLEKTEDDRKKRSYRVQSEIWRAWLSDLFVLADSRGHTLPEQREAMLRFLDSASKSAAPERSAAAAAMDAVRHVSHIPTGERLLDWLRRLLFGRSVLAENACPGKLFCLPLRQGWLACREHVYVLGLGHGVFSDRRESAVLLDRERAALSPRLSLGRDAGRETRFRFLQLLLNENADLILCWPGYDAERQIKLECARELEALRLPETEHTWLPRRAECACDDLLTAGDTAIAPLPEPDPGGAEPMAPAAARDFDGWLAGREFSPSSIETALRCPFKFYLIYALGARDETLPVWHAGRWLEANARGKLVHEVLENYYKALKADPDLSLPARTALEEELFRESWRTCLLRNPPPDDRETEDAERALQKAMVRAAIAWTDAQGRAVRETEQKFGGSAAPVTLSLGSRSLRLRGQVDRLDECPDGTWAVLDYKTGDPEKQKQERDYHIQHYFYAEAERVLSGGAIDPGEAGYLMLGGLAKGAAEAVYFKAEAADNVNAALVTERLLEEISDEETCLTATPWVARGGTLVKIPLDAQLELLRKCRNICPFRELCPLCSPDKETGAADAGKDGDDGKGGTVDGNAGG